MASAALVRVAKPSASDPRRRRSTTYLAELAEQRRQSPHTVSNYRRDLARLLALAGDAAGWPTCRCTRSGASSPSCTRRACPAARWRARCRPGAASIAGSAQRGAIAANPCDGVRAAEAPRLLPKALSVDQAAALLDAERRRRSRAGRPRSGDVRTVLFVGPAPRRTGGARCRCARRRAARGRGPRPRQAQQDAHRAGRRQGARGAGGLAGGARATGRRGRARPVRQPARRPPESPRDPGAARTPGAARRACRATSIRTCCATPSPRTCCSRPATCARCRKCSATPASPRRRSIRISTSSIWPRFTMRRIRAPKDRRRFRSTGKIDRNSGFN